LFYLSHQWPGWPNFQYIELHTEILHMVEIDTDRDPDKQALDDDPDPDQDPAK
jgi:hypothetical protein